MCQKLSLPALALSRAAAAEVAAAVRMMSIKSLPVKHDVDVVRDSKERCHTILSSAMHAHFKYVHSCLELL